MEHNRSLKGGASALGALVYQWECCWTEVVDGLVSGVNAKGRQQKIVGGLFLALGNELLRGSGLLLAYCSVSRWFLLFISC